MGAVGRRRGAAAAVALGLAALLVWALLPTFPNYDSYYHLVWGRELLDGELPGFEAYSAPTQHPLWVLVAAVVADERLLVLLTAFCHVAFVLGVFRLGELTFGRAAGLLAALFAGSSFALLLYAARAYVDTPFLALVIWAAVLAVRAAGRSDSSHLPPLALLAVAGLLRPEAWVLAGLHWLWVRDWRLAPLVVAAPLLWALTDLVVTGDPLWSLNATSELADELGRPRGVDEVPESFVRFLGDTAREPVALLGALGMSLAWRRRVEGTAVVWALFAAGAITFVGTGVAGLSILPRYLTVPAVALCLFAGYAAVAAWDWDRRVVVAVCVLAAVPVGWFAVDRLGKLDTELAFTRAIHDDLDAVVHARAVQRARACGPITLPNYRAVPDVRWLLDASGAEVGSRSARQRDRGVALVFTGDKAVRRYGRADGTSPRNNRPPPAFGEVARRGFVAAYARC